MEPLDAEATCYWAPEVLYDNGRFLMYYSVGNEERMQIRVSVAEDPAGPFVDSGHRLTQEDFAIDPHVFTDEDGARYLFYATDFLTHTHIGTGTVCDRMLDEFKLAGEPRPVTRAKYDWQIYDPQRKEKGGVRWHTVEGPSVLKRKGLYYQMFSGGNWRQGGYGVSYAVADKVINGEAAEWEQIADGQRVLPILRTVPGHVMGPGHNSVVRGPDNRQLFCVYHRWAADGSERLLSIDPLDWAGERMLVIGPSFTQQPAPISPIVVDYFDNQQDPDLGADWSCPSGQWQARDGVASQSSTDGEAVAHCRISAPYFVAEVSLRLANNVAQNGSVGIKLFNAQNEVLNFRLTPSAGKAVIAGELLKQDQPDWLSEGYDLPAGFDFAAFHLLRVEVNWRSVAVLLDGHLIKWVGALNSAPDSIALMTENATAEFAGFALTEGWEDSFDGPESSPAELHWTTTANDDRWQINQQQLWFVGPHGQESILTKGPVPKSYELVISAKMPGDPNQSECYGILPAVDTEGISPLLRVDRYETGWAILADTPDGRQVFPLSADFDPNVFQHFRFRKQDDRLTIQHEATILGEISAPREAKLVGLYGNRVVAGFDFVRVTRLNGG